MNKPTKQFSQTIYKCWTLDCCINMYYGFFLFQSFKEKNYIWGNFIFRILWHKIFQINVSRFPRVEVLHMLCKSAEKYSGRLPIIQCFVLLIEFQNNLTTKQFNHRLQQGPDHFWHHRQLLSATEFWQVYIKMLMKTFCFVLFWDNTW